MKNQVSFNKFKFKAKKNNDQIVLKYIQLSIPKKNRTITREKSNKRFGMKSAAPSKVN